MGVGKGFGKGFGRDDKGYQDIRRSITCIWAYWLAWEGNIYQSGPADPGTVQSREIHNRDLKQMALEGTFTNRTIYLHNISLVQGERNPGCEIFVQL